MIQNTDSNPTAGAPGSASGRDRLVNALRARAAALRREVHEAERWMLSQAETLEMWARLVPTAGEWVDVEQVELEDSRLYLIATTRGGVLVQDGVLAHWTKPHGWLPIHIDIHYEREIAWADGAHSSISVFLPNNQILPQEGR